MGTASEVTGREVDPTIRGVPTFPVDVLMIPGVTLWGPINVATIVADFDDFVEKYRRYMLNYETPVQVRQFFLGGGKKAIVNRVVHINASGVPVTAAKASKVLQTGATAPSVGSVTGTEAAPYALVNGDTLVGKVDGLAEQTATVVATAASLENGADETFALADAQTLTIKVDGGSEQTITFNTAEFADIANATAEEVAAVINAELVGGSAQATSAGVRVTIYSDTKGSNSKIQVTGGTANAVLSFSTTEQTVAGNNVADASSVTVTELKTMLEAAWTNGGGITVTDASGYIKISSNTTGTSGSVQVVASSTADDELGLDNAVHSGGSGAAVDTLKAWGKYEGGTIGNAITLDIAAATSGEADQFNMIIYYDGVAQTTLENLTMDSTSDNYVETRLAHEKNESLFVDLEDLEATGTATERRPANGTGFTLTGGDDGLTDLDDNDFIGQEENSTGIYAFDQVDEGDTMICPDRATTAVQNAMTIWLENNRRRTACGIPDPSLGLDSDGAMTHAASLTPTEAMQALPWPGVKIPNPDKAVYGGDTLITIKPSGSIAGRLAYNTQNYKTHAATQPANEIYGRLINVVDVETNEVRRPAVRRKITPAHINPIMAGKDSTGVYGVWLNDTQALKNNSNFKSIGENRMMALIRKSVFAYLETIRGTPNTPDNRLKDQKIIEAYLEEWTAREALASTNTEDAFYVNTDPLGKGINNALVQEREEYKVLVAVATARSRRFVETLFTRDQRAIEAALQQQLVSP